jgi:hypothetical protein
MHVLSLLYKLREHLTEYPGGIRGFLRAPRSQNEYFVDLREDFTYTTDPLLWREIVVTGKDFEEYVKMFLAEFSGIA